MGLPLKLKSKSASAKTVSRNNAQDVLAAIFDTYTLQVINAAIAARAKAKRKTKLTMTDLVRESATKLAIDYKALNAWLTTVFIDEELLQESEAVV